MGDNLTTNNKHPVSCFLLPTPGLETLQQALGYRFRDPDLLVCALTHSSYVNEHPGDAIGDNQRL